MDSTQVSVIATSPVAIEKPNRATRRESAKKRNGATGRKATNKATKKKAAKVIADERRTYSVDQFCAAHQISRAFFYILQREGGGPRIMKVRGRTLVSVEAAAAWRHQAEMAASAASA